MVRRIKRFEMLSMRVRPPCPYQDGFYGRKVVKIVGESSLHRLVVLAEGQSVDVHAGRNELFYFIERVCCLDVHTLDSFVGAVPSEPLPVECT